MGSMGVTVGHAIGRIRQYMRMRDPYKWTAGKFGREFRVVAGLASFGLPWDKRNKKIMHGF